MSIPREMAVRITSSINPISFPQQLPLLNKTLPFHDSARGSESLLQNYLLIYFP
jgi:hypothetical protein